MFESLTETELSLRGTEVGGLEEVVAGEGEAGFEVVGGRGRGGELVREEEGFLRDWEVDFAG